MCQCNCCPGYGAIGIGLAFRNTKLLSRLYEIIQLIRMPVKCAILAGIFLGLWMYLLQHLVISSLLFYINPFMLLIGGIVIAYAGFHAAKKGLGFEESLIAAILTALVLFDTQLVISVVAFFTGLTPGNPSSIDSISGYLYSVLFNFPGKQYIAIIYGIVAGALGGFLARRLK